MSERKSIIVILTPGFPENEQDTTCLPFLQDYLSAFTRLYPSVNVKVISFQYPFRQGHYLWKDISVYSAGGKVSKGLLRLPIWFKVWRELKLIKREHGIDAIHSLWLTECTLVGQRFAKRFNIKQVAYAIGQDVLKTNRYLELVRFKKMTLIAMSESIAERFRALTGHDADGIIQGGVDIGKVNISATERTIDIIGVGALTPLKNYMFFLEIIASLKDEFPKIKVCLIGKGEQEQLLREKAKVAGLQNMVHFAGEMPHRDVFSYLNKSKIFLHTSGYEGQSTVMMEALAVGLTVVCFDVGRMHIEGKVVVCKDKEEMMQQVRKLLSTQLDYTPAIIRTADDMARDFAKIYGV